MFAFRADVDMSGPVFDGRARRAVRGFVDDLASEVADGGVRTYLGVLRPQLRAPTGRYESHIRADRVRWGEARIWDGGRIPYGPWLEGVGSRNFPVTRFPGYRSAEKATPLIGREVDATAAELFERRYRRQVN